MLAECALISSSTLFVPPSLEFEGGGGTDGGSWRLFLMVLEVPFILSLLVPLNIGLEGGGGTCGGFWRLFLMV